MPKKTTAPAPTPPITEKLNSLALRLRAKIKARIPFIWIVSDEEQRVSELLTKHVLLPLRREIMVWSCSQGIRKYSGEVVDDNARGLDQALSWLTQYHTPDPFAGTVLLLQDPHMHLSPMVARLIRDMYIPLQAGQSSGKTGGQKISSVIMISGRVAHLANGIVEGLEPSIVNLVDIIDLPLPSKEELSRILQGAIKSAKENKYVSSVNLNYNKEQVDSFAGALQGLTQLEALRSVTECFHLRNQIELNELQEKKRNIVKQDGLLEVIENLPDMNQVGGLDEVKRFVNTYTGQFSDAAKEFGLEPLRGILSVGVPGCGKSLCAKAIAALWNLPCIRLDVGKVMSGVVGSSEANIRRVIKVVEAAAPCLLFVDEIEKQMSGTQSSSFSDSGTTARVFGTLLTAMEEGLRGVTFVATANDISLLPPELIRRFDELFFVDLPVTEEREEIFRIHLSRRKRNPDEFDLTTLIQNTHGFTGSEIEKVVKVGIANAFSKKEELKEEHMLAAVKDTRPLSRTMAEQIERTRKWAKGRARRASSLLLDEERVVKIEDTVPSLDEVMGRALASDEEEVN